MSFRRNKWTIIKCLIIAVTLVITVPLLLRTSLLRPVGEASAWSDGGRTLKLRESADAGDVAVEKVLKPPDQRPRKDASLKEAPRLIDWHDRDAIAREKDRKGPGEGGSAYILTAEEEKLKSPLYQVNGFNALASDKISLSRSLSDIRHPDCRSKMYLNRLPTVSVVIPFHNEHWTTLLRSVTSIVNRSPTALLREVILTDDFSNKDFLGKPLDEYVTKHWPGGKVKVVRAAKREGLIRTRILGAKEATGDVLIFLDSHVEANLNWLPPLLDPIARDKTTVVCPFIDVIDYETFAYRAQDEGARGAFDWEFFYKRLPLLPQDLEHPAEPFKSPVMAGGLFAIDRDYFWKLGGYDPGLDVWGGEQYELSFKIWQCGGTMVDAPCSRVGHIYRKFAPFPNPGIGDFMGRNYKRVAEVWMDEYKEYLYERKPYYRNLDAGDLTDLLALRKKLNCKPFSWFMKEVAFDLPKHYPPVEPRPFAEGELRNVGADLCVDTQYRGQNERFQLRPCISDKPNQGGEQRMELSWHEDLRPMKRTVCFDVSVSELKAPVILYSCHGMQGNQKWVYDLEKQSLYHPISAHCLQGDATSKELFMNACDPQTRTQRWKFTKVNEDLLKEQASKV